MEDTASDGSEYLRDHKIGAVEYMALEVREFSGILLKSRSRRRFLDVFELYYSDCILV